MDRGAWWATAHIIAELDTTEATEHTYIDGGIPRTQLCIHVAWIMGC